MKKSKTNDEPSKEEILASIKRGMKQALRGEGRPAHEFLDEIEREMGDDVQQRRKTQKR